MFSRFAELVGFKLREGRRKNRLKGNQKEDLKNSY